MFLNVNIAKNSSHIICALMCFKSLCSFGFISSSVKYRYSINLAKFRIRSKYNIPVFAKLLFSLLIYKYRNII